jgi:hypothetical protein
MSNAIASQGFTLQVGVPAGASPTSWTAISEIVNGSLFDGKAAEIDVTHLQSVAKEIRQGLQDFGQVSIDVNYIPSDAGQNILRMAKASQGIQSFRATFSNGTIANFQGYVLSAPISLGVDSKVDSSFDIRVSGGVSFA